MNALDARLWREVAWNRVRFMAPADWALKKIDHRHLVFETAAGPAMEIKWNGIKGAFSHDRHLRQLSRTHRKQSIETRRRPVPKDWQTALDKFESSCFSWKGSRLQGLGVLLFCPVCRTATLIQFMGIGQKLDRLIAGKLLATFSDHSSSVDTVWSVFDIRALLPKHFDLTRYRFEPGTFELSFHFRKQKISLFRWAPASVLLSGIDLRRFAERTMGGPGKGRFFIDDTQPMPMAVWKSEKPADRQRKWWSSLGGKPLFQAMRCWHSVDSNRLLGIAAEGKTPFDPELLDHICNNYESI